MDEFFRCVNEEDTVVRLALLEDDDADCYGYAEKQVFRQLYDRVYVVVAEQILTDFTLCPAAVENSGKFNNGCRSGCREA